MRVCASCGTSETAAATVIFKETTPATCSEEGIISYTAYAEFDKKAVIGACTGPAPMLDHTYNSVYEFNWSPNTCKCEAVLICTVCDQTERCDCAVTESAGPNPGDISYIASVTVGGNTYTDTMTISAPPHVHNYSLPEIRWISDEEAVAVSICSHCAADAPEKVISIPCDVSKETVDATCSAPGKTVFTAKAEVNGISCEDTRTVTHEKLAHTYESPVFIWNGSACTYRCRCTVGGEVLTDACRVTEKTTPATCFSAGMRVYTAIAKINGKDYTDTLTVPIPALDHQYSAPVFEWGEYSKTCAATVICTNCDETETVNCTVTQSEVSGSREILYTAEITIGGRTYTDTMVVSAPAETHSYSVPEIGWNRDHTAAAISICSHCAMDAPEKVVSVPCTVTETRIPSTCSTAGTIIYTASAYINGMTCTDSITVPLSKLDHDYTAPVFTWDGERCSYRYFCTVGGETKEGTCTVTKTDGSIPGEICFTASVTVCGRTYTDTMVVSAPAETHSYSVPEIGWNRDHTAAAISICSHCAMDAPEKVVSVPCTVTETRIPSTCSTAGTIIYTASAYINGMTCTDSITVPLSKLDHDYTAPVFTWDGERCSYQYSCTVGGETKEGTCTVTKTDGKIPGEILCTASIAVGGRVYTDTKTVPAPPPSVETHCYSTPEIRWSEDYKSAAAISVCSHCADHAQEKIIRVPCKVSESVTPATCSADGAIVYTAQATVNGIPCGDRKTVLIPALSHNYTLPVFTWNGTKCTFSYSCTVGGETHTGECRVTESIETGTCTVPGTVIYTASVTVNNQVYTEELRKERPAEGHTDSRVPGTAATCTEAGITDGIVCSVCGEMLLEGAPIEPLGHAFGTTAFSVNADGSISAVRHCSGACGETLHGTVTVTIPDEDHPEQVLATAEFPDGTTVQTLLTVALPEEEDPEVPDLPSIPGEPITPVVPDTPIVPVIPDEPDVPDVPDIPRFSDVMSDSYYYDAVIWAEQTGITRGTGEGIFSPDMICTRAQVVTMLWRAAGSPAAENTCSFEDVPDTAYYIDAVAWAAEMGITVGTSATTFSPDLLCTRAQILTMLWRAAGCPEAKVENAFSDVTSDAYYAGAVAWAVKYAITNGTGVNTFSPDLPCSRAQIVTFLWRAERKQ